MNERRAVQGEFFALHVALRDSRERALAAWAAHEPLDDASATVTLLNALCQAGAADQALALATRTVRIIRGVSSAVARYVGSRSSPPNFRIQWAHAHAVSVASAAGAALRARILRRTCSKGSLKPNRCTSVRSTSMVSPLAGHSHPSYS